MKTIDPAKQEARRARLEAYTQQKRAKAAAERQPGSLLRRRRHYQSHQSG